MIAINPSDLDAVISFAMQCVVAGLVVSAVPSLVGMLLGFVYRTIEGRR